MQLFAQAIGLLWMFSVATIILAILVDLAAERMRMRRRRITEAKSWAMITHPSNLAKTAALRSVR